MNRLQKWPFPFLQTKDSLQNGRIKIKFVQIIIMAAPSLDNELMHYWSKLSIVQQESILGVIKSFVEPNEPCYYWAV